ncbi:MAG: bifunctional 5,10-methylene-tetrahydrofolate dehydrogenase/5,10-methylene-tetrahydrofolate cyclohydrolase [Flavobacteriales bacterium]|jgi:methylenetetrahydrofolate dehydrogenase (NADP+)/methenyltetrahydrofolate cyclohydrolase|uniref:bifunctional 5,10-methylenetetrahydrofolate dehydrogenase/5,10-methenyltetrahydrofolate cyclohydrolase n=1 Tax=Blattabacterium sp. (Mastotermes darwiniensis) TaxID=39768 RepID=UPI000231DFCA|nr:tetrahydrofolate dehydrogenase/cyclohydrolase catalytic domain-containing protein [Blattabacterium sp. (Mastotermes darwiniensis)]AER40482.1 putative methenyltetrahydrofolate cyclohydrolase [Blattabacterium sp. (Mastotermes darwiniensis) str. MADAR]MDR1805003.1 bifunctional 5,10-methylene-tetrahydrofolate dehydrogenase/5,10-methylene-tetrahydrofolate cyclohydrolase [Flavobacteriales bacterium]
MTKLLNGKKLAIEIRKEISKEIEKKIRNKKKPIPHLGIILLGNNSSSILYVNRKIQECKNIGIQSSLIHLPVESSENELIKEIQKMNQNPLIDGFIVQLPLQKHINTDKIILSINPKKDVDGFHPENFGKMSLNMNAFFPATALGILTLLEKYKIQISGKYTVVIGRSRIVGRPISILMSRKKNIGNSTVTLTHSHTPNIKYYTKRADIIIISVGIPGFLTGKMIKKGAVIIDVGINRIKNGKNLFLKGDVDFHSVYGKASYLTPVPGGVGPMTIIMLIKNTLRAALNRNRSSK